MLQYWKTSRCVDCDLMYKIVKKSWKVLNEQLIYCTDCSLKHRKEDKENFHQKWIITLSGQIDIILDEIENYFYPELDVMEAFVNVETDENGRTSHVLKAFLVFHRKIRSKHIYFALYDDNVSVQETTTDLLELVPVINLKNDEKMIEFHKEFCDTPTSQKFKFKKNQQWKNQEGRISKKIKQLDQKILASRVLQTQQTTAPC